MEKHIRILGILYIVFGIIHVLAGAVFLVLLSGIGYLTSDYEAFHIISFIGIIFSAFFVIVSLPGIIGGMALLYRKEWARIMVLILGILILPAIPFGTALGIYTIWVLSQNDVIKSFSGGQAKFAVNQ